MTDIEKVEYVSVSTLKKHNKNPRVIKNRNFHLLMESIKKDPKFLEARPILCDEDMIIYAGNQRYQACLTLGWKEVPVIITRGLSEEQKKERMLRDNLHSGEFDINILYNDFDNDLVKSVFDDDKIFEDLIGKEPEPQIDDTRVFEEMELKNFESHDYLVFAFSDYRDFLIALQKLNIGKVNACFSPKGKKIGIGRVLDGKILVGLIGS